MLKKWFGRKTDFREILNRGAIIVDVRSPEEFAQDGLSAARNIPLGELSVTIDTLKSENVPVICICAVGIRARQAKGMLEAAGIEAYNGINTNRMSAYV